MGNHPHCTYLTILQARQLLFYHGTIFYTKSLNRTSEKRHNMYGCNVFKVVDFLELLQVFNTQM